MARLRVREIAESKGFTMSSLSRRSDISFNTIKRVWKEPGYSASIWTLERIAQALGVKIADLIDEES